MRWAATTLARASAVLLVTMAAGPVCTALAAPPNVTIASPLNGSASNRATPSFSGLAEDAGGAVTLGIYSGPTTNGTLVQEMKTALFLGGTWSLGPVEPLKGGTYTAQATQTNLASETGSELACDVHGGYRCSHADA